MWVKAQDGSLINLNRLIGVEQRKGEDATKIYATMCIDYEDSNRMISYNLGTYSTERKARNVMNAIARGIMEESKLFYMPQEAVKNDGD